MSDSQKAKARAKRALEKEDMESLPEDEREKRRAEIKRKSMAANEDRPKRKYVKKADRERDNSSNYNPAKESAKPIKGTIVYNEEGKKIGKRDSQGVMHPYKSRGRPPKNLGQKQTGLTEPDS